MSFDTNAHLEASSLYTLNVQSIDTEVSVEHFAGAVQSLNDAEFARTVTPGFSAFRNLPQEKRSAIDGQPVKPFDQVSGSSRVFQLPTVESLNYVLVHDARLRDPDQSEALELRTDQSMDAELERVHLDPIPVT